MDAKLEAALKDERVVNALAESIKKREDKAETTPDPRAILLSKEEAQLLTGYLDIAVKTLGLKAAQDALVFAMRIAKHAESLPDKAPAQE